MKPVSATLDAAATPPRPGNRRLWLPRLLRALGWLLIGGGVVMLLYLVYLLWYTNLVHGRLQADLLDEWSLRHGPVEEALPAERVGGAPVAENAPPKVGAAYAAMWFERPGTRHRPANDNIMYVVEGVTREALKQGPGHYPDTAAPGSPGNFGVAGHRTTYGAPFYHLDQLQEGDEIHVVDRYDREWVYRVTDTEVVLPDDTWVIGPDPLGTGRAMLTLTTCEPRFSAAKRLIVFAELQT